MITVGRTRCAAPGPRTTITRWGGRR